MRPEVISMRGDDVYFRVSERALILYCHRGRGLTLPTELISVVLAIRAESTQTKRTRPCSCPVKQPYDSAEPALL